MTQVDGPAAQRQIAAVIFDVDDTLVDTKAAFAEALSAIASHYLPRLPVADHHQVVALWRQDPDGYYRAFTRGEMGFREQRYLRAEQVQRTFGGREITAAGFDAWDERFEAAFQAAWQPFEDAADVLALLRDTGLKIGAVTNAATAYQWQKLERTGLKGFIATVVGVDELGYGKPSPDVFTLGCDRLGVTPPQAVYVGDELDIDARAAITAGLAGVWVDRPAARRGGPFDENREQALADGVLVIENLSDLPAALQTIRSGAFCSS
ncbi:putative hydrolase of the HAD superfamily [Micrococcales bacterium KH10]|nr:putative hydrolase of the HAD superfamily [Micrococcales bacterium KH10]